MCVLVCVRVYSCACERVYYRQRSDENWTADERQRSEEGRERESARERERDRERGRGGEEGRQTEENEIKYVYAHTRKCVRDRLSGRGS